MKAVLILEDRFAIRDQLINQGDKAIAEGTHNLLQANQFKILSGGFKNFPYFNLSRFKKVNSTEEIGQLFKNQFIKTFSKTKDSGFRNFIMESWLINHRVIQFFENMIRKKFSRGAIETIDPFLFRNYHAYRFHLNVQSADVVMFNGGGLLADHLEFYLPCYLFEIYAAKQMGKKVALANCTISVENPLLKKIVYFVLKDLDLFLVREPRSKGYLAGLGIDPGKVRIVPDFSFFALDPHPVIGSGDARGGKRKIGFFIRGDRKVNYPFWIELIKILAKNYEIEPYFFHSCQAHDQKVFNKLSRLSALDLKEINPPGDYHELIEPLSKMQLVLTDRYHGAIFSLFAKVPFIGIEGTTFKINGLFELMDYPLPIFSPSEENLSKIKDTVDYVFENHSTLIEQTKSIPELMRQKITEEIQILNEL